jgi:archaellum component FlaC
MSSMLKQLADVRMDMQQLEQQLKKVGTLLWQFSHPMQTLSKAQAAVSETEDLSTNIKESIAAEEEHIRELQERIERVKKQVRRLLYAEKNRIFMKV